MRAWVERQPSAVFGARWNVRIVDGTRVCEPGPTGSTWQVHYSIGLPSLGCDEFHLSPHRGAGESFKRFTPRPGDLLVGDRAYGLRPGIFHVAQAKADVLTRFALDNLPLLTPGGDDWALLPRLARLRPRQIGDWPARLEWNDGVLDGRVCAVRKSRQATEKARRNILRRAQHTGRQIKAETLEAAAFTFVFTTVGRQWLTARDALEIYRGRWQIEIVFKRLKSILAFGHLRKSDPQAARAWLHGKLLVALLVETLMRKGQTFFPWGYPLCQTPPPQSLSLA